MLFNQIWSEKWNAQEHATHGGLLSLQVPAKTSSSVLNFPTLWFNAAIAELLLSSPASWLEALFWFLTQFYSE